MTDSYKLIILNKLPKSHMFDCEAKTKRKDRECPTVSFDPYTRLLLKADIPGVSLHRLLYFFLLTHIVTHTHKNTYMIVTMTHTKTHGAGPNCLKMLS